MSSPLASAGISGYQSKTVTFKSTADGDIKAEVFYPENLTSASRVPVLIHYHGGFLIVGDRFAFLPYWLVHACAARGWVFVSPEYRLLPETTAHAAVEDAVDAYDWVLESLSSLLDRPIGPILVAGSSAGGYLALTTATAASMSPKKSPAGVLAVYGMLDPANERYTTPGTNIFGRPAVDVRPILNGFPKATASGTDDRQVISAYAVSDPATDKRFSLVSALHLDAIFPDYLTGVDGLSRAIATDGPGAIAKEHAALFPLNFGDFGPGFPPVMLLHGANDSAVPVSCSAVAAEKLRSCGISVVADFPVDAEHGWDTRAGNVDVESSDADGVNAVESLRSAVRFLADSVASAVGGRK
ncbi:Alpha/Beta hydrolase protein [Plectosphaerella plurivora]|uniref:Alpha/Beta hydrolase protein n=1 Tax=Plectosphaerella plurivora TaxID=936078 RepID=A0A9P8VAX9_9PEZI|nr:Alpha/Beta hydrolase protein [Plectosphaerella plurivora]